MIFHHSRTTYLKRIWTNILLLGVFLPHEGVHTNAFSVRQETSQGCNTVFIVLKGLFLKLNFLLKSTIKKLYGLWTTILLLIQNALRILLNWL